MRALFEESGIRVLDCAADRFGHTTVGWYRLKTPSGWASMMRWKWQAREAEERILNLVRQVRPDVVHLNSVTLAPYARCIERVGVPVVIHVRERLVGSLLSLRRHWLSRQVAHATAVIAICLDNAARVVGSSDRIEVILNPVDLAEFNPDQSKEEARRRLGLDRDREYVLFAGGSDPLAKGLDDFLLAMTRLHSQRPRAVAVTAGFVPPAGARERHWTVKRRIRQLLGLYRANDRRAERALALTAGGGLAALPFTRDISSWIAASDVVCVPHVLPHFSRTVLEAGAMRRPVVGYSSSGVRETIESSGGGLLVPERDVAGLAKAIACLLDDPARAEELACRGFAFVRENCSPPGHSKAVGAILERAVARFAGRVPADRFDRMDS